MAETIPVLYGVLDVARALGVSRQRVYQLIDDGRIRAVQRPGGDSVKLFTAEEIERVRVIRATPRTNRSPAEIMIHAAELFARGADLMVCVRELNLGPTKVRRLYDQWRTPLGGKRPKTEEDLSFENERSAAAHEKEMSDFAERQDRQRQEALAAHARTMRALLEPSPFRTKSKGK